MAIKRRTPLLSAVALAAALAELGGDPEPHGGDSRRLLGALLGLVEVDGILGAGEQTDAPVTIREAQRRAWANKLAKGFNTTDVPLEFGLLYGEVAEAFDAWRKDPDGLAGELADAMLYLVAIAEMTGVDLATAVAQKMAVNEARVYRRTAAGVPVKVEPAA